MADSDQDPVSDALSDTVEGVSQGCFGSFIILALIVVFSATFLLLLIKDFLS